MADKNIFTPEENRQIILAAFQSLDTSGCSSKEELERLVVKRSLTIKNLMRDDATAMRTLDASVLWAQVSKVEWESSSQRYIITFRVGDQGDPEYIRTPRMDRTDGKVIKDVVEKLKAETDAGRTMLARIYKNNEPAAEDAKGPNVPSKGYRVAPWIEVVGEYAPRQ